MGFWSNGSYTKKKNKIEQIINAYAIKDRVFDKAVAFFISN